MPKYIDAEKLEKDGWSASRTYQQDAKTMVYETKKMTDFPAANVPERNVGKWIKMSDADGVYWACSECGEDIPRVPHYEPQFDLFPRLKSIEKTNFCPNCGADMRNAVEIARDIIHSAIDHSTWSDTVNVEEMHRVVDDKYTDMRGEQNG